MHNEIAVSVSSLTQRYKLYGSPREMAFDVFGLYDLIPWRSREFKTHTALDNVTLTIKKGERVGIIGRNGAGKTTLLKLITGKFKPTSGQVQVSGRLQSLMSQGVGFHPEFTGRQNVRSSLVFNGISEADQEAFENDIFEFAELGSYIDQPLKTYSLGMKARLGFAAATAIRPDILIVDEVLGAGDAFFAAKSALRMKRLTQKGITLLLVSHSTAQILQFCERVIWLEGGKIAMDGEPLEVIRAYERFVREMENERLHSQNQSAKVGVNSPQARAGVSRWPGSNQLKIGNVRILGSNDSENNIFRTGQSMSIELEIEKYSDKTLPCTAAINIYTLDGFPMTLLCSSPFEVSDSKAKVRVTMDKLLLKNGEYVFSVAIYPELDFNRLDEAVFYDLIDRSYRFKVYFDFERDASKFRHPCVWDVGL